MAKKDAEKTVVKKDRAPSTAAPRETAEREQDKGKSSAGKRSEFAPLPRRPLFQDTK